MKLIPKITPEIITLLNFTPLQYMAKRIEKIPEYGMVYTDDEKTPSTCVVRIGHILFFGGNVTPECISYIKDKIFTFEIYEIYGVFDLIYPNEAWRDALTVLFPERCKIHAADYPMIFLDLRDMNRDVRVPEECDVMNAVKKYLPDVETVNRVPKGGSTYVYRAKTPSEIYYARFLPEDCSFAVEVTAHKIMAHIGVKVPQVVAFEQKESQIGLSMMIASEIPGVCMDEAMPDNPEEILREAGRQLALIHTIPVDGFGWIDRNSHDILKGEKNSFPEYFDNYLADDLICLQYYDCKPEDAAKIRGYMEQARLILSVQKAVLVHGDFDTSHIYHSSGKFSGFIDFGEIRGNNRLYDLALFAYNDHSPDRTAYKSLIGGYCETAQLTSDDLYAVELMALFIVLRFAGKKVEEVDEAPQDDYWYRLVKNQLERINQYPH
ncbi:MAG: aminoglycoside phosphotransferase family protein [Oscillospiraceae bacterium]|nr:aminoglycoside phosphotransferase family protein [Oscillospiraceae bacterium]